MREFESVFDKGLLHGLRSESVEPAKEQRLIRLKNLRSHEFGLRPIEAMVNPISEVFNFPFPQLFLLREFRLMATETAIYECDESWNATMMIGSLVPDEMWQVADFGKHLLMTNGSQMVQRNGATGAWTTFASTSSIPAMATVCDFRGQAVGGNISGWEDCDVNYVAWSDIGSLEFYPGLRNEAGYAPMSWNGAVLRVLPLGDFVAVYGENGVSLLKPAKQYMAIKDLDLPGIPVASAVGGSTRGHLLVDYGGDLWLISAKGEPKKLGYSEFMLGMDASKIVISYNRQQNEYYISDGTLSYVLGVNGLSETHQLVSSCAFDNGVLQATWESDGYTGALVITDVMDFGQRAYKTLSSLGAGCSSSSDMWTDVFWRSDIKGTWNDPGWQWINPTGFTTPMITAVDFKLAFRANSYEDVKLGYLKSRLKLSDRRMIRGIHSAA